jgi:hypothetical protein
MIGLSISVVPRLPQMPQCLSIPEVLELEVKNDKAPDQVQDEIGIRWITGATGAAEPLTPTYGSLS